MNEQPLYRLTLRALEPSGGAPADVRLAAALKALLRNHFFRCVEVREIPAGCQPCPACRGSGIRLEDEKCEQS